MNTILMWAVPGVLLVVVGLALVLRRSRRASRGAAAPAGDTLAPPAAAPRAAAPAGAPALAPRAAAPADTADLPVLRDAVAPAPAPAPQQIAAEALRQARQRAAAEAARREAEQQARAHAEEQAREQARAQALQAAREQAHQQALLARQRAEQAAARQAAAPAPAWPPAPPVSAQPLSMQAAAQPLPPPLPARPLPPSGVRPAAGPAHPAAAVPGTAAAPLRAPPRPAGPPLVLLADDSKVVRVKTGRVLEKLGCRVLLAEDGADALRQLDAQAPDLVITDVEMPEVDGFQLTRRLRAHPRCARVPVIMITSSDDKHRAEAQAAGVDVLLGKPYAEETLVGHVRQRLGARLDAAAPALH